jgi:hypothetical protein
MATMDPTGGAASPTRCGAWASSCTSTRGVEGDRADDDGLGPRVVTDGRARSARRRRRPRHGHATERDLAATPASRSARPAASSPTAGSAHPSTACGPPATAPRPPPGQSAAGVDRARHDRQQAGPGRRHQPRGGTRRSPACSARPSPRSAGSRSHGPASASARPGARASRRRGRVDDRPPTTTRGAADRGQGRRRARHRRLLGAQIVGEEGAAKRIDVFADRALERDDGRRAAARRPVLRAAVLAGVGPGPDRCAQGQAVAVEAVAATPRAGSAPVRPSCAPAWSP